MTKFNILFCVLSMAQYAFANEVQIAAGFDHTCALDWNGVKCWGDNSAGQTNVPSLNRPTQIAAGSAHSCAIDQYGVKCWGWNQRGQTNVPRLNGPIQVAAGNNYTCALDREGVKCWGNNIFGATNVPRLNGPIQVTAGMNHTCALDKDGVKCWGRVSWSDQVHPPESLVPTKISSGGYWNCGLYKDEVQCWGLYGESLQKLQSIAPRFSNTFQIALGNNHGCAVLQDGVDCWLWGPHEDYGQTNVPKLNRPTKVAVGYKHSCALDQDGVKCWGSNEFGQTDVPEGIGAFEFSLHRLDDNFRKISQVVYKDKQAFFANLSETIANFKVEAAENVSFDHNVKSRIFALNAIYPLLENIHSEIVEQKVMPAFRDALNFWNQELNINSLNAIELSPEVLEIIFVIINSSLDGAKNYLDESSRAELTDLKLRIAQAKAEPTTADSASRLLDALENHNSLLMTFVESERTRGFGGVILQVKNYLVEKN